MNSERLRDAVLFIGGLGLLGAEAFGSDAAQPVLVGAALAMLGLSGGLVLDRKITQKKDAQ